MVRQWPASLALRYFLRRPEINNARSGLPSCKAQWSRLGGPKRKSRQSLRTTAEAGPTICRKKQSAPAAVQNKNVPTQEARPNTPLVFSLCVSLPKTRCLTAKPAHSINRGTSSALLQARRSSELQAWVPRLRAMSQATRTFHSTFRSSI